MDLALDILALIIVDLLLFLMIAGLGESIPRELHTGWRARIERPHRAAGPGRREFLASPPGYIP